MSAADVLKLAVIAAGWNIEVDSIHDDVWLATTDKPIVRGEWTVGSPPHGAIYEWKYDYATDARPGIYFAEDPLPGFTPDQMHRVLTIEDPNVKLLAEVNALDHVGLAKLWRFAESGDPRMQGVVGQRVKERLFNEFGGFTTAISKMIGWAR